MKVSPPASEANTPSPNRPSPPGGEKVYYHDLDIARGVLMALGVVLHTANVYALGFVDGSGNTDKSALYAFIGEAIHLFRMPAFFLISGFLCVMSLTRYGAGKTLRSRSRRLLIPFFTALFTFNIAEFSLTQSIAAPETFHLFSMQSLHLALTTDALLLHLWFLIVLFIYVAVATGVFALLGRAARPAATLKRLAVAVDRIDYFLLAPVFALSALAPHALGALFPQTIYDAEAFGLRLFTVLQYAPYFAFGALLYFSPANFGKMRRFSLLKTTSAALLLLIAPLVILNLSVNQGFLVYLIGLASWMIAFALFGVFSSLVGRLKELPKDFGDMTYTIYLSHHVIVTGLGAALAAVALPRGIEFLAIIGIVTAATWALQRYAVRKSNLLKFFLNGQQGAATRYQRRTA